MNNSIFSFPLQLAHCRVARESPTTPSTIAEVTRVANETWVNIHDAILRIAGVENDGEFWNNAQNQFKLFTDSVQSSVNSLREDVSINYKTNTNKYKYLTCNQHLFFSQTII